VFYSLINSEYQQKAYDPALRISGHKDKRNTANAGIIATNMLNLAYLLAFSSDSPGIVAMPKSMKAHIHVQMA
jgi:hypothetical protein